MLNTRAWSLALAAWFGITFTLCVAWCAVAPEGWHARSFLELALPGFTWLTPGSFAIGLIDSLAVGAYSGALVSLLHNGLSREAREARPTARAV